MSLCTTHKSLSISQLNSLLQLCSNSKSLHRSKQTHQHLIVNGQAQNQFMMTKLLQVYSDCKDSISTHRLFDELSQPNVFAWTAILSSYSRHGMWKDCFGSYREMKSCGVFPDKYVFPKILRACAQSEQLRMGIQVHKDVIACGDETNIQVCNSLIDMYSKCGEIESARWVFSQMGERDLLSWNSIISGYLSNGFVESALDLFDSMKLEGFAPDLVSYNTAIDAYCRMGKCDEAYEIFEQIKEPNIISWTTLISGYSRAGNHTSALIVFRKMMNKGEIFPDLDCISSVIVSCRHLGDLKSGKESHAYGIKIENLYTFYKSAGPALLTMYARCRKVRYAAIVFAFMDKSDVVSWNAMISGYAEQGKEKLAFECFRKMQSFGIQSDQTTISAVLPVCDLESGKKIHANVFKNGFNLAIPVSNAIIHMYCKCGCIEDAHSVFSNMLSRDLISWNTMIGGFARHGLCQSALQLLKQMKHLSLSPNLVTFTSLLFACNHTGHLKEGPQIFHMMVNDFGLNPTMEHYACVIDLMARYGQIEEAISFMMTIPLKPDKRIWGSLLSAAQSHHNVYIGMLASENLVELEPEYAGHYVTLANIYARAGRWNDAKRVRNLMESRGLVKLSGYSWVES